MEEGTRVRLPGDAVDPDGDTISVLWTSTCGSFDNPRSLRPVYTAPRLDGGPAQAVILTLMVTDQYGLSTTDSARVQITRANRPPQADAGSDLTLVEGTTARLFSRGWDPDGDRVSFRWSSTCGRFDDPSAMQPQYTAPMLDRCGSPLSITLTLTVTDAHGASSTDTARVRVVRANRPPVADAGRTLTVREGETIRVLGCGHDPDGDPVAFYWTSSCGHFDNPTTVQPYYTAPRLEQGVSRYVTLALTVTDQHGASGRDEVLVHVVRANQPPVADAGHAFTLREGASVRLAGRGWDPDGGPVTYQWTASSGSIDDPTQPSAGFTAPRLDCENSRNVTLTLTVTDSQGASTSDSILVCILRSW